MNTEPFSLKPGYAYRRLEGEWEIEIVDEVALTTAVPAGECHIDGAECVDFRDSQGREWAQTKVMAREEGKT